MNIVLMQIDTTPLISIILPTYNREYCLGRAINSVVLQTYSNWELIVIDNQSTDGTDNLLAHYLDPRIKVIKISNNGNIAKSRNKGLSVSRGTYVAFLDSDDWWSKDKLNFALDALEAGADLIYTDAYLVREHLGSGARPKRNSVRQLYRPVLHDLLFEGNCIFCSSVVTRRELLTRVGGFSEDERLIAIEDFDLWLKLASVTEKFTRLKNSSIYYAHSPDSASTSGRTVLSSKHLIQKYASEWDGIYRTCPPWISYGLAISHYRLKYYKEAQEYAVQTLASSTFYHHRKIMFVIKSIYIILKTWLRK